MPKIWQARSICSYTSENRQLLTVGTLELIESWACIRGQPSSSSSLRSLINFSLSSIVQTSASNFPKITVPGCQIRFHLEPPIFDLKSIPINLVVCLQNRLIRNREKITRRVVHGDFCFWALPVFLNAHFLFTRTINVNLPTEMKRWLLRFLYSASFNLKAAKRPFQISRIVSRHDPRDRC